MIEKLSCANCESIQDCEYINQVENTTMKGININSVVEFYRCLNCSDEFYLPGMMDKNLDAMRRSYLIKMGVDPVDMDRKQLIGAVKLAEEREKQRRSFAFGNCNTGNPYVTREMVNDIADKMRNK